MIFNQSLFLMKVTLLQRCVQVQLQQGGQINTLSAFGHLEFNLGSVGSSDFVTLHYCFYGSRSRWIDGMGKGERKVEDSQTMTLCHLGQVSE